MAFEVIGSKWAPLVITHDDIEAGRINASTNGLTEALLYSCRVNQRTKRLALTWKRTFQSGRLSSNVSIMSEWYGYIMFPSCAVSPQSLLRFECFSGITQIQSAKRSQRMSRRSKSWLAGMRTLPAKPLPVNSRTWQTSETGACWQTFL